MAKISHTSRAWIALAPAMALPFLAALFYFVLLSEHWVARVIYGLTKAFTLVWPLVALRFVYQRKDARFRLVGPGWAESALAGTGVGLGIVVVLIVLMAGGPLAALVEDSASNIRLKAAQLGILENYWLFGLFLAVAHSLIEEYYWRWFVYGGLRELLPVPVAHAVAGLAFAAHHVIVASQFFGLGWGIILGGSVGLGGAAWSVMFQRHGILLGAWVSHMIVDFGLLIVGHRLIFGEWILNSGI